MHKVCTRGPSVRPAVRGAPSPSTDSGVLRSKQCPTKLVQPGHPKPALDGQLTPYRERGPLLGLRLVESAIGHTQAALKGLRFETLDAAQAYLDRWDAHWADTRIHGTRTASSSARPGPAGATWPRPSALRPPTRA